MINALHLLWIAPVCGTIGFMAAAIISANNNSSEEEEFFNEE